jgi:hypothetical protein
MSNISKSKTIAVVSIELDKPRQLKYTNGALRKFQEKTGKAALKMKPEEFNEYLSEILWAGLLHEDKDITVDQVDEMIGPSNMYYVIGKVTEAWGMSMPEPKEVEANADPLQENLPT